MTRQVLNVGSAVNAGDGDSLRVASIKINDNFNELYGSVVTLQQQQFQTADWNSLLNKPTLFSGSYNDLTNKPTLSTVAASGSYNDLTNKPELVVIDGNQLKIGTKVAAEVPEYVVIGVTIDPTDSERYFDPDSETIIDEYLLDFIRSVYQDSANSSVDWSSYTWDDPLSLPSGVTIDSSYDIRTNVDGYAFAPAEYRVVYGSSTDANSHRVVEGVELLRRGSTSGQPWAQGSGYDSREGNQNYRLYIAQTTPEFNDPASSFEDAWGIEATAFHAIVGKREYNKTHPSYSYTTVTGRSNDDVFADKGQFKELHLKPTNNVYDVFWSSVYGNMFYYMPITGHEDEVFNWSPRPDGLPALIIYTKLPDPENPGTNVAGWYYFDNDGLKYANQPPQIGGLTVTFR